MGYPVFGTHPIKCGKVNGRKHKCTWMGYETDLVPVPVVPVRSGMKSSNNVCPKCGCASYYFMDKKEADKFTLSHTRESRTDQQPKTPEAQ